MQRFKQTYVRFSEADLGLEGTTKNVWLQQTIDREETLRSGCPDRYQWLIAYGQSYQARRKVLGLAILDVKLEADPPCCYLDLFKVVLMCFQQTGESTLRESSDFWLLLGLSCLKEI